MNNNKAEKYNTIQAEGTGFEDTLLHNHILKNHSGTYYIYMYYMYTYTPALFKDLTFYRFIYLSSFFLPSPSISLSMTYFTFHMCLLSLSVLFPLSPFHSLSIPHALLFLLRTENTLKKKTSTPIRCSSQRLP